MRTQQILFFLLTLFTSIHALALPISFEAASQLFKRKGGGGGGGKGGGGSTSASSSSGSSGSSGSRGSGGSSGTRTGGTGPQPAYGAGGAYYGGGAARPFSAGTRSPGGINPFLVPAAGVAFLGAGALAYGAYFYPYSGYYTYHNNTANRNETYPAECYCARYAYCGCDQRNETDYVNSVANDKSVARVADVNGTDTLLINGTLPNGTEPGTESTENVGLALTVPMGQFGGWAVIGGAVGWAVWLM